MRQVEYPRGKSKHHQGAAECTEKQVDLESCGWDNQVQLCGPYKPKQRQIWALVLAQAHMLGIASFIIIKCGSKKGQCQRYRGWAKSTSPDRTETNTSITIPVVRSPPSLLDRSGSIHSRVCVLWIDTIFTLFTKK